MTRLLPPSWFRWLADLAFLIRLLVRSGNLTRKKFSSSFELYNNIPANHVWNFAEYSFINLLDHNLFSSLLKFHLFQISTLVSSYIPKSMGAIQISKNPFILLKTQILSFRKETMTVWSCRIDSRLKHRPSFSDSPCVISTTCRVTARSTLNWNSVRHLRIHQAFLVGTAENLYIFTCCKLYKVQYGRLIPLLSANLKCWVDVIRKPDV